MMKRHGSMNHIFRLVWSQVLNGWVAVAEKTRGRGKSASRKFAAALAATAALTAGSTQAAPAGGQVVTGSANIAQTGATTTITQASSTLALNWKSFNIAKQETVNFVQPTAAAIAVNRIFDTDGTQILGHVNANGQVFLINPNGVLFGKGAAVNVGGLVASTLALDSAQLDGNTKFFSGAGAGSVVNEGVIKAGYVALLGQQVSNQGVISAQMGTVALGAGSAITLDFNGNSLLHMQIDQGVLNNLANNGGLIEADGGQVLMSAGARNALLASVVNNAGVIQAHTVQEHEGVITLQGGMRAGSVHVGGRLDASAPVAGNGGAIETSAAHVDVADGARITTAAVKGVTGRWLIDPVDFTIAASGGNMTGVAVAAALANSNFTILSSSGNAGSIGNLYVNDTVSWSGNKLTLNAYQNIYINAAMSAGAAGSLALQYGQGGTASSTYFVNAPISLPAGQNFSTQLGSNAAIPFTVITSLGTLSDATTASSATTLQGMAGTSTSNLSGHYALGADIDASVTQNGGAGYSGSGSGFIPIGDNGGHPFAGVFDGLGHTISKLHIHTPNASYVGLFGNTSGAATIENLTLYAAAVAGDINVGALVGNNAGHISNDSIAFSSVSGTTNVGGLVGNNTSTGTLLHDYAMQGSVSGTGIGTINSAFNSVGGLVGYNAGTIVESYSSVAVSGDSGYNSIGGLVGQNNSGTITDSYSIGQVSGNASVGGLAGANYNGKIMRSYAAGLVTGTGESSNIGGLIGSYGGGVLSNNFWDIGATTQSTSGGTGANKPTGMSSLQMQSKVNFTAATSANGNANPAWSFLTVAPAAAGTWFNYDGDTYPLLTYFMTPLTVSVKNGASATYNGSAYADVNGVNYSISPAPQSNLAGKLSYSYQSGDVASPIVNAGVYTATPAGLYSNQQGYIISYGSGTLTILPSQLTASIAAVSKVYDGNASTASTTAAPVFTITSGLVNGETLTVSGTAAFDSKNAGMASHITVDHVMLNNGTGLASNYSLGGGEMASATILPKILTAKASAGNKVYDGTASATPTLEMTASGLVGTETLVINNIVGTYNSKNVSDANVVTVNSLQLANGNNGGLASNYSLPPGETASGVITAKALTATLMANNKVYDGTTSALVALSIDPSGLIGTEIVTATGMGAFNTKNVASANRVTVNQALLLDGSNGGLASNYSLGAGESGFTANANITAKALMATAMANNKVYDGNTTALPVLSIDPSGLIGTETVTAIGTGAFNSKNVATANTVTVNMAQLMDSNNGGMASNYSLLAGETASANITRKALTATAAANNKVYDATTAATAMLTIEPSGLIGAETVTATGIAAFNSKDVLSANQVTVNNIVLADGNFGGLASNYQLPGGEMASAHITLGTLTYTATPVNFQAGQAPANLSGSLSGFMAGDTLAGSTSGQANWTTTATAGSAAGAYPLNGGGLSSLNYAFIQSATNAAALTVSSPNALHVDVLPNPSEHSRSPTITETQFSSASAVGDAATAAASSAAAAAAGDVLLIGTDIVEKTMENTRMSLFKVGSMLQIVYGGVKLLDDKSTQKSLIQAKQ